MLERFLNKIEVDSTTDCHNWTDQIRPDRYGDFRMGERKELAHRASWLLLVGDIPESKWVLHHCDNRSCVNPDHLYIGTHQDNMDDMVERGRSRPCRGETNGNSLLTQEIVEEIREKYSTGIFVHVDLAIEYNTSLSNIGSIIRNETW